MYSQLDTLLRGILFLPFLFLFCVSARQFNVTIDDQEGDPTNGNRFIYTPQGGWNIGQDCSRCTAKVFPGSGAYLGTWMDATYYPNGTLTNDVPGQIIEASIDFVGAFCFLRLFLPVFQPSVNRDRHIRDMHTRRIDRSSRR